MSPVEVLAGNSPIILGQPHGGTFVPDALFARLNDRGRGLSDTDWHIARLYDGLLPGVTVVRAKFHRYIVDANRDPADISLYPGQNTTSLCPTMSFDGLPIWQDGEQPGKNEIAERIARFHAPYHAALSAEIARVKSMHGVAIVYDCHSIRSTIPFLFAGVLPVFSIGTNDGQTCALAVSDALTLPCLNAQHADTVVNGRFKGGWTTRHYGEPDKAVHAIQMELAQRAYLAAEAAPWDYAPLHAEPLRKVLATILHSLDSLARSGALNR